MLIVGRFFTGRRARQRTACLGISGLAHLSNDNDSLAAASGVFGPGCAPDGTMVMRATAAVKKGREVCNTYGELSNAQLLQRYGFVEEGNRHDTVRLSLGRTSVLWEGLDGQELRGRQWAARRLLPATAPAQSQPAVSSVLMVTRSRARSAAGLQLGRDGVSSRPPARSRFEWHPPPPLAEAARGSVDPRWPPRAAAARRGASG